MPQAIAREAGVVSARVGRRDPRRARSAGAAHDDRGATRARARALPRPDARTERLGRRPRARGSGARGGREQSQSHDVRGDRADRRHGDGARHPRSAISPESSSCSRSRTCRRCGWTCISSARDAQHITPGVPVEIVRLSDGVSAAREARARAARARPRPARARWRAPRIANARWPVAAGCGGAPRASPWLETPVTLRRAAGGAADASATGRWCSSASATPTKCGRSSSASAMRNWVQVQSGIAAGDEVVVEQSYLVKADIEKSGATHDH